MAVGIFERMRLNVSASKFCRMKAEATNLNLGALRKYIIGGDARGVAVMYVENAASSHVAHRL